MKQVLLFQIFLFILMATNGQKDYKEAIQLGDEAFKKGQYKTAIDKYFAAEAFDPSKKDSVKKKVNNVFDRIEALKNEADKSRKEAVASLDKANKLISTFYFYKNRFALAHRSPGVDRSGIQKFIFYYIDQDGNTIYEFGEWHEATAFKESGFAKVKTEYDPQWYMLDTFGHQYPAAYDLKIIDSSIQAVDLSESEEDVEDSVFYKIAKSDQLQVLILNGSYYKRRYFFNIPGKIGYLKNLKHFQMSYCSVDSLTSEIGELRNLEFLQLSGNNLEILPARIGELTNLTMLDLGSNKLTDLPVEIGGLKNLKILKLGANQISSLPPEISRLKNLKTLILMNNKLTKVEKDKIRKLLPNCHIEF